MVKGRNAKKTHAVKEIKSQPSITKALCPVIQDTIKINELVLATFIAGQ